jgi:hypothetical protein
VLSVGECLANVDQNLEYWVDAHNTATGLQAECPIVLMKMRHVAGLLGRCRELVGGLKARGISKDALAKRESEIAERLEDVQGKLLPNSELMVSCKKWTAEIMARPVESIVGTSAILPSPNRIRMSMSDKKHYVNYKNLHVSLPLYPALFTAPGNASL